MNKKIAVVGTVGLPAKYGGFETLVEHIVENIGDEFNFLVYCSKKAYPEGPIILPKAELKYIPLNANGIQSIPYDIWSILHALRKCDELLILGVSGCIILPFVKIFSNKKIVVNIDGLEWKRGKWGKLAKLFLKFSESLAVRYADAVVADNGVIQEYVKESYNRTSHLIAYGGDHTQKVNLTKETLGELPFLSDRYAFKVCRIEPENNVELILKAFASFEKLNLVIVGNWEHSVYAKSLRKYFEDFDNIFLLDPIYDQQKLNQLRSNCYIYVHGHSAGGTNPSLVEAMYLKLPVLAYGINYNKVTTNHEAVYFNDESSLINNLVQLELVNLDAIGEKLKSFAENNYTWAHIANQYRRILLNIL